MILNKELILSFLETKFEKELAIQMVEFPIVTSPADVIYGHGIDKMEYISIILEGSVRAIKYDEKGGEILIYNIQPLQSCIISINSILQNHGSPTFGITNSAVSALLVPKSKTKEWIAKYETWRNFIFELYDWRLNELIEGHQTLQKQKDSILQSIHYAKRIQNAVLPPDDLIHALLLEHFILFKPRDIVSGDYYWMTQLNEKTIVVAADCTGHGVPGAFMSMLGISLLNQYVNTQTLPHANEILDNLRDNLKQSLNQTDYESETKDGMDMALMIFDNDTKELEYAGANNPMYIIRDNELTVLEADKMPVGVYVGDAKPFTKQTFKYKKNDVFYTFSDGFIDQVGGEQKRKFMRKNFLNLLMEVHKQPMKDQKNVLENTLLDWIGVHNQVDDILVVGIRV